MGKLWNIFDNKLLLLSTFLLFIVTAAFLITTCNKCNKDNAPSTNYKPLYDSLLKEYVQLQTGEIKRSDSLKRMYADSITVLRKQNAVIQNKKIEVKKKYEGVKNDIDNLSADSLSREYANF